VALRQGLEERDPLGADGQAVGGVLDVCSPVATTPSAVSRAAPTAKFENGARRSAAGSTAASHQHRFRDHQISRHQTGEERDELVADAGRRGQHFLVHERLGQHARRHVGDARDAGDLDAHVPRHDRLGHGGHPDRVGAHDAEGADLGRRLVARPRDRDVDAFLQMRIVAAAALARTLAQARRVGHRHVREARPEALVVGPTSGLVPSG
jgi:hypothetical protein